MQRKSIDDAASNAIEELEATARLALMMRGLRAPTLSSDRVWQVVTKFDVAWDN